MLTFFNKYEGKMDLIIKNRYKEFNDFLKEVSCGLPLIERDYILLCFSLYSDNKCLESEVKRKCKVEDNLREQLEVFRKENERLNEKIPDSWKALSGTH